MMITRTHRFNPDPVCPPCYTAGRIASAFTLVEVLVSSTIAVLFITSILGLMFRLEARHRSLAADTHGQDVTYLREIIHRDLLMCRSLSVAQNEMRLQGAISTEPVTGAATLRPASVRYFVEPHGNNAWLVREEFALGSGVRRDVLWVGVARMIVTSMGAGTSVSRVRVQLDSTDNRTLLVSTLARSLGGLP